MQSQLKRRYFFNDYRDMSKNRQVITVSPPLFLKETGRKEQVRSAGHICSHCHGNGWFWRQPDGEKDSVKEACPICGGSGRLDAVITIEWYPSEERRKV